MSRKVENPAQQGEQADLALTDEQSKPNGQPVEAGASEASVAIISPQEIRLARRPSVVLKEATEVAEVLRKEIFKLVKPASIRGKQYPLVEHWTTVASFFGVYAKITRTQYVEFDTANQGKVRGWEAHALAVVAATGQVVSEADAMCCDDEPTWEARPLHALRAMAQTRAVGRVLRNPFSRIMVLAGVEPTPAEEMPANGEAQPGPAMPQRKGDSGAVISEPQRKRLFAIARERGWQDEEVKALLKQHGYEHSNEVRKTDYDKIIAALEGGTT